MNQRDWPRSWRMEGLQLVTMDPQRRVFRGAIEVTAGRIAALGPSLPPPRPQVLVIERKNHIALPGFIQGHLHVCQTLFRGLAEDRRLDRWLTERILPLEAAHDPRTLEAAARLGVAEALLHGATTLVDMGTVRHNSVIARVVEEMGVRAIVGKAMMDAGEGAPAGMLEETESALREALTLHEQWHGAAQGRIQVAFAPRFTLSVSKKLWKKIAAEATRRDILVHTHVSETPWENETCRRMHGDTPIRVLARWGVLAARALLVHAVWIDEEERGILRRHGTGVIHCPGSNAKLGSGIADLPALLEMGIAVGLGSDGAACNDELSLAAEMRLAAQMQSLRHGPGRIRAREILAMATIEGARATGLEETAGSLEVGKRADLTLFDAGRTGWETDLTADHGLVFAATGVRPAEVFVDGRPLVLAGKLVHGEIEQIRTDAREARARLLERMERGNGQWKSRTN